MKKLRPGPHGPKRFSSSAGTMRCFPIWNTPAASCPSCTPLQRMKLPGNVLRRMGQFRRRWLLRAGKRCWPVRIPANIRRTGEFCVNLLPVRHPLTRWMRTVAKTAWRTMSLPRRLHAGACLALWVPAHWESFHAGMQSRTHRSPFRFGTHDVGEKGGYSTRYPRRITHRAWTNDTVRRALSSTSTSPGTCWRII